MVAEGLDAIIVWRTIAAVLRRDGLAAEGHVTAPQFTGSATRSESA